MYNKIIAICIFILCAGSSIGGEVTSATANTLMAPITLKQWNAKLNDYPPNILVVDMWAMWCTSCIERFPEMVKLHRKYNSENITFVSLNLDDREDFESLSAANLFLDKMNADFEHYHMDENLMLTFEKLDLIGIPAVLIYDQQGIEQFRLTGDNPNKQFTEDDIEKAIQMLLNQ